MKKFNFSLAFLFLSLLAFSQNDVAAIKTCFANYRDNVARLNGNEVVKYLDSKTIAYYDKLLNWTVNGNKNTIMALGTLDKLMVLTFRHRLPKGELLKVDGKGLYALSVIAGLVPARAMAFQEIGEVRVNGNSATGNIIAEGKSLPVDYAFSKEGGQWKLNVTSLFSTSESALKKQIASHGKTENDSMLSLLELGNMVKPTAAIWNPLR